MFGVPEQDIIDRRVTPAYRRAVAHEVARAREYYKRARRGVFMLSPESRLPVQASLDCYSRILDKIEENGYDNLNMRAYVGKAEKAGIVAGGSWYRAMDVSRDLPLWGEEKVVM